jgi:hypothetical protein
MGSATKFLCFWEVVDILAQCGQLLKPQQQMHLVPETSQQQNIVVRYGARLDNGTIRGLWAAAILSL